MTHRIIITDKGRKLQKELDFEQPRTRSMDVLEISPVTSLYNAHNSRNATPKTSIVSSPILSNSRVKPRGGYFGPKSPSKHSGNSQAVQRSPYYPNYLRKSAEDYPSEHFEHKTPAAPLLHMRSHSSTISDKELFLVKKQKPIDPSIITNSELPIRYVHHTIYPYTLPDKPDFALSSTASPTNSRFFGKSRAASLGTLNPNRIDTARSNQFRSTHQGEEHLASKYDKFRRTAFNETNTIVADHFTQHIVDKYSPQKLSRITLQHSKNKKAFTSMLETVEKKYQSKIGKLDEDMNIAPEFLQKFNRQRIQLDDVSAKRENEKKRYLERIAHIQRQKYDHKWSQLQIATERGKQKRKELPSLGGSWLSESKSPSAEQDQLFWKNPHTIQAITSSLKIDI